MPGSDSRIVLFLTGDNLIAYKEFGRKLALILTWIPFGWCIFGALAIFLSQSKTKTLFHS